jgi:hypothetical protein
LPTVELNARTAPRLSCQLGVREITWWSQDLPGFGKRCRDTGGESWVAQARLKWSGKLVKRTIGDVRAVSFADALRQARDWLSAIHRGHDPADEARKRRAAITVRKLVELYLDHQQRRMKPRSYVELRRHLEVHSKPLHLRLTVDVTQRDIVVLLQALAATAPIAANRARAGLSSMFVWGMKAGLVPANPVAATFKPGEERSRERTLSDEELGWIWDYAGDDRDYGILTKLLMLTGARRAEIGGMSEGELARHADGSITWVLPRERAKNGRPNELILPPMIAAVLPSPRVGKDGVQRQFLFGTGKGGFSGWAKCKRQLDVAIVAAGHTMSPWVLHDLRRTLVTRMNDLGVEPHVVEALVNHTTGSSRDRVAGTYNLSPYRVQKRDALALWCRHIEAIIGTERSVEQANVVPLLRP